MQTGAEIIGQFGSLTLHPYPFDDAYSHLLDKLGSGVVEQFEAHLRQAFRDVSLLFCIKLLRYLCLSEVDRYGSQTCGNKYCPHRHDAARTNHVLDVEFHLVFLIS